MRPATKTAAVFERAIFEVKAVCAFNGRVRFSHSIEVAGEGAVPSRAGRRRGGRGAGLSLFWGQEVTPSDETENHSLS